MVSYRLLEDGVSKRLLEDGSSRRLLETPPTVTWSPTSKFSSIVLSNNNLTIRSSLSATIACVRTSIPASASKIYAEIAIDELGSSFVAFGVCDQGFDVTSGNPFATFSRTNVRSDGGGTYDDGNFVGNSPNMGAGGIAMLCYDDTTGRFYTGYNGAWIDGANPSAGTGGMAVDFASGAERYIYGVLQEQNHQLTANFSGPFIYPVPTGFSAFAPAAVESVYKGGRSWPAVYRGQKTDGALYKGTRSLHA